jgi:hypothetical protein
MSFSTAYLTPRETSVWDLRRRKNTQSEIGRLMGFSRQASHHALELIDEKVEKAFDEAASTNGLEVKNVNLVDGIMEAYSPVHKVPVFVSLSRANGLRVWYMHEGECNTCQHEKGCRSFLEKEAAERGIDLHEENMDQPPTQLALTIFGRYLGGQS